jgi:hypothetical protein
MRYNRNVYKILVAKRKWKRPLGRPMHILEIILKWLLKGHGEKV